MIQVIVPGALRVPFEEWLHRRNLELVQLPGGSDDEESLPLYIIGQA
jgi:hypothetical protein